MCFATRAMQSQMSEALVETRTKNLAFLFVSVQASHRIKIINLPLTGIKNERPAEFARRSSGFRTSANPRAKTKNPRMTGGFVIWGTWTRTKNK